MASPVGCPHQTQACPLYLAGHVPGAPTCMAGDWQKGCAVDRGYSYDHIARRITVFQYAAMYGFTFRAMIGPGRRPLHQIWPWLFDFTKEPLE